ncbi:MAG TPA: hypothetical protein VJI71_02300 [Candidatus Norongarragalinales archaeon]|nr:hypothetical protein [Candidatus Norongarragalinales archaeon]
MKSGYYGSDLKRIAIAVAVIAIVAYFAFKDFGESQNQARSWMNPVITKNEFAALEWVEANTPERTVFASDIFGGELLMSALREGTEGGDWAIVPNVVERMRDAQYNFYEAKESATAWATARKYGAEYAWVPDRQIFAGYDWKYPNYEIFENQTYFEKVFDNGHKIYRIK